jgi:uncharacterized membrane protein (UPF0136 family)
MVTLVLILLLLAALFGILGAVLKVFLILLLAGLLFAAVAIWAATLWFRGRVRAFERAAGMADRRGRAVDVRRVRNQAERDLDRPDGV